MLKNNQRFVTMVLVASLTFTQVPICTETVYAEDIVNTYNHKSTEEDNYEKASSFFKEKYLSTMEIKNESIFSTDVSNFENMYRLSLDIYDNNLTNNSDSSSITSSIYSEKLIEKLQSYFDNNDDILKTFYTKDSLNSGLSGININYYFYSKNALDENNLNDIINKFIQDINDELQVNLDNTNGLYSITKNEDISFEEHAIDNVISSIGKTDVSKKLFNINSQIPSEESIPYQLNINAYTSISLPKFSKSEKIESVEVVINNDKKYLLSDIEDVSKLLLNNLKLTEATNISVKILTVDSSNNIKTYYSEKNIEKSSKSTGFNFVVDCVETKIKETTAEYIASISCNESMKNSPVFSCANLSDNTSVDVSSIGNESISFEGTLDSALDSLDIYYMDSDGYIYSQNFSGFIDLKNKYFYDSKDLTLNFNGIAKKDYYVKAINDIDVSSQQYMIENNSITLDWINENYFINNGLNSITLSNNYNTVKIPFYANISNFNYTISSSDLDINENVNSILSKNNLNGNEIKIVTNEKLDPEKCSVEFDSKENNSIITTKYINSHTLSIKLDEKDNYRDIKENLNIKLNNNTISYKFIKDTSAPKISVKDNNVKNINNIYYFKGDVKNDKNNAISFNIIDSSSIKNIEVYKDDSPLDTSQYDFTNNVLTINNLELDKTSTYKIVAIDDFGNKNPGETFNVYPDTTSPEIKFIDSNNDQYRIANNNIYIMSDNITENKLTLNFKIFDNEDQCIDTIDPNSIHIKYKLKDTDYEIKDFQYKFDPTSSIQSINLTLPEEYEPFMGEISISVDDVVGNKSDETTGTIRYFRDSISRKDINFTFTGTILDGTTEKTPDSITFEMDDKDNFTTYISKELKDNIISLDFSKDLLNNINSAYLVRYSISNENGTSDVKSLSYISHDVTKNIPFKLAQGENIIEFEVLCENNRCYTGKFTIIYDYSPIDFYLLDNDGKEVLTSSKILTKPIKSLLISDPNFAEIQSATVTINDKEIPLNEFKKDGNNYLYELDDFKEGFYYISYDVNSIFDSNEITKTDFNNNNKSISKSKSFVFDITKPTISSDVFTENYTDTIIYSTDSVISIGKDYNNTDVDINIKDNLDNKLNLSYKIKNIYNETIKSGEVVDLKHSEIDFKLDENSFIENGQYYLELIVSDEAENTTTFVRPFIIDDTSPEITISDIDLNEKDYTNNSITPTITVKDDSLKDVTITLRKFNSSTKNFEDVYVNNYSDFNVAEEYTTFFKKTLDEIKEDGIYQISVTAKDRKDLKTTTSSKTFTIDTVAPLIDMKNFTNTFSDCIVFSDLSEVNHSININTNNDEDKKNSIHINDDYSKDYEIEYKIFNIDNKNIPIISEKNPKEINLDNLEDGRYQIEITVTDDAGNSNTNTGNFIIDSTAPMISLRDINVPSNRFTNTDFGADISVTDNSIDNIEVNILKFNGYNDINPSNAINTIVYNSNDIKEGTSFNTIINNETTNGAISNLDSGIYKFAVTTRDRSGHSKTTYSDFIILDKVNPTINTKDFTNDYSNCIVCTNTQNTNITIGPENSNLISLSDNLTNNYKIRYKIYSEYETSDAATEYTYTGPISTNNLFSGRYKIDLYVYDDANNLTTTTGYFIVDNENPTVTITGLEDLNSFGHSNKELNVNVTVSDLSLSNTEISLRYPDGTYKTFNTYATLSKEFYGAFNNLTENGEYILTVSTIDRGGHSNPTITRKFTIDTVAPRIEGATVGGKPINSTGMNYTTSSSSPIVFNFNDNVVSNDQLNLNITVTKDGTVYPLSNGGCLHEDGVYNITAYVTDLAGNISNTYSFTLTVDTNPPKVTIEGISDGYYYNKDISATWKVDDNTATITATLNGNSYDGSLITAEGDYTLVVTATDPAGNTTTETIKFVIDKTAPKITVENIENLKLYTNNVTPLIKWDDPDAVITMLLNNINYHCEEINKTGSYVLYVKAVDKAGNISDLSLKFRLNVTKPEITFVDLNDNDIIEGPFTPKIKFDNTVEYHMLLNGKEYYGEKITAAGKYTLEVTAIDTDGIETKKTIHFTIKDTKSNETVEEKEITPEEKKSSNLSIVILSLLGLLLTTIVGFVIYIFTKKKDDDKDDNK